MAGIDARRGSLTKRHTRGGWRWCGQIRYKDEGGRWHTMLRALTDDDGDPILTDADTTDDDGKRVQTTRNIRKARRALEAWRAEVEGTPTGGRLSVAEYIRADLEGREGSVQGSTMRKYREYVSIIENGLEGVAMRDLDAAKVRRWVQGMKRRGLAPSTAKTAFAMLTAACNRAVQNGDMAANPCERGMLRTDGPRPLTHEDYEATKPNALDTDGVRRANALLDATGNGRLRVGARLALTCGLRAGECCGIRWRDLDLDGHALTVREAIGRADGGTYNKPPKTPDSNRTIPLAVPICAELAAWRDAQGADRNRAAEGQEGEVVPLSDCYILGYADGSFMTPHALGNAWARLAAHGDADGPLMGTRGRRCTFHDLRHTFATHAIANGADVRSVAALMGHKDASVTLRIYADVLPDAKARAMDAVSATLAAGSSWATPDGDSPGDRPLASG